MLDKAMIEMMAQGIWDTCYMTLVSTFFGYVIGLPLGIALTLTDENGITPNGRYTGFWISSSMSPGASPS